MAIRIAAASLPRLPLPPPLSTWPLPSPPYPTPSRRGRPQTHGSSEMVVQYEGEWVQGRRAGKGTRYYANGETYTGEPLRIRRWCGPLPVAPLPVTVSDR